MSLPHSMSAAVTSRAPAASMRIVRGSLSCMRMQSCLSASTMLVTSSRTPGMVENSCRTPSIWMEVTAAPSKDESSIRRRLLPNVVP